MRQMPPYPLIAKYLATQSTPQEDVELLAWRNALPENEKLFAELSTEWELANKDLSEKNIIPDREKVWNKIQQRIRPLVITYPKAFVIRVASIAATIALVLGLSVSYLFIDKISEIPTLTSTFIAPVGQKSQLVLTDGTKVWLNSGSTLSYTNKFGEKDRAVRLKGEAFFDVTKNKDLKFIVNAGKVNVVVHGTAFNVKSYPADENIAVSLLRGKVDVVSSENSKSIALLAPGQRVVVGKQKLTSKIEKCDADIDGIWRLEKLKFEGATIAEIAEKLGKWYGLNIEVKNADKFQKYWFTVKSESVQDILKSMNGLHPIKYSIKGNSVEISSR
jgi:ferric-dicitrate binding protein FerR (iron transport regulator)